MGRKTPLMNDFRSGEMTPGLGTRSDLKAYDKGCIVMENCMPLVEGGIERVSGSRFVRTAKLTEEGWSLRITRSGDGDGDVDSDPVGIDCGPTCYTFFIDGTSVELTATPDAENEFIKWTGDGTGTPVRTVVMNGNKVVNAEFSSIPLSGNLVGWYKFDEGSGATVINHATGGLAGGGLFPNLTVLNPGGDFWTFLSGFGSTPRLSTNINYARGAFAPTRTIGGSANGYFTFGLFFKHRTIPPGVGGVRIASIGADTITFASAWNGSAYTSTQFLKGSPASILANIPGYAGGEWWFLFISNDGKMSRVRANGTKDKGALVAGGWPNASPGLQGMNIGAFYNWLDPASLGAQGSYGDSIFYNFTTLTDAQWAIWYDRLRSRYGMAARSGW